MLIVLNSIIAIYRKELQSYFMSPLAYIVTGLFWFITGLLFFQFLLGEKGFIAQGIYVDLGESEGLGTQPFDAPYEFLGAFLNVIGSFSSFILPILSMGMYAEERKLGTLELLATSPITNWAVAVGKLLGVLTFYLTMIMPLLGYEVFVFSKSSSPISLLLPIVGHLGLILLAASMLSLGMFISSLTDSSILSAFMTFCVVIFLWIIDIIAKNISGFWGEALGQLSLFKHYNNLIQGIFDTNSLMIFISYIILGIFLTAQSIEALRFQRS